MSQIVFCPACVRILYPVEDKINGRLIMRCKYCDFSGDSPEGLTCVYRHELIKEATSELEQIKDDVVMDPTLQRAKFGELRCGRCGGAEAVFFQAASDAKTSKKMSIFFVCTNCKHKWQR